MAASIGVWVAVGVGIGLVVFGDLGLGIVLGIVLGAATGAFRRPR